MYSGVFSGDLGWSSCVDCFVVFYGFSYAPEEYVGCSGADVFEGGAEAFDDLVVVVCLGDCVEPGLEAAVFMGDALDLPGVVDCGEDLALVADDAGIVVEAVDVVGSVGGDLVQVEVVECGFEVGPLVGDEGPVEACLEYAAGEVAEVG